VYDRRTNADWPHDPDFPQADPTKVGSRAKKRGLPQLGTLGAGNHYAEIQVVEEIADPRAAARMGIDQIGQVGRSQGGG